MRLARLLLLAAALIGGPRRALADDANLKGFLTVYSERVQAEVRIDGDSIGLTPVQRQPLVPGAYLVTVSASGFATYSKTVQIESGRELKLAAALKELPPGATDPADSLAMRSFLKKRTIPFSEAQSLASPLEDAPEWLQRGTTALGEDNNRVFLGVGVAPARLATRWEDRLFACELLAMVEVQKAIDPYVAGGSLRTSQVPDNPDTLQLDTVEKWGHPAFTLTGQKKTFTPSSDSDDSEYSSSVVAVDLPQDLTGVAHWSLSDERIRESGDAAAREEVSWKPSVPNVDGAKLSKTIEYFGSAGLHLHAVHFAAGTTYCLVRLTMADLKHQLVPGPSAPAPVR